MTELFSTLKESILIQNDTSPQELKKYELFLSNQALRIKKNWEDTFNAAIQKWLEYIFSRIIEIINGKDRVRIKLQLEGTYAVIQQKQKEIIEELRKIQQNQLYHIHCGENRTFQFKNQEQKIQRSSSQNQVLQLIQENRCVEMPRRQKSQSLLKNRSLSGPKRRLSNKLSVFAQAKKIQNTQNFNQTAPTFNKQSGQKIKKTKKKQQTCFTYLQKAMSSTSPSNFMLNYMNNHVPTDEQKYPYRPYPQQKSRIVERNEPNIIVRNPEGVEECNFNNKKHVILTQSKQEKSDTKLYQNFINNFEQKITLRLDELMDKYVTIEKKLDVTKQQQKDQIKKPKFQQKQIQCPTPTRIINNISENVSQMEESIQCPQAKTVEINRQLKHSNQIIEKQPQIEVIRNSKENKQVTKSISQQNKVIRNKVNFEQNEDDQIEVMKIDGKKQVKTDKFPTFLKKQQSNRTQHLHSEKVLTKIQPSIDQKVKEEEEKQKKLAEKQYLQIQIFEFYKTTTKVILPISKKLLFSLKSKYQKYCEQHNFEPISTILKIESQALQKDTELRELLMKMQKILNLKCEAQKLQKIQNYVSGYLRSLLCINQNGEIIISKDKLFVGEESIREGIKLALKII